MNMRPEYLWGLWRFFLDFDSAVVRSPQLWGLLAWFGMRQQRKMGMTSNDALHFPEHNLVDRHLSDTLDAIGGVPEEEVRVAAHSDLFVDWGDHFDKCRSLVCTTPICCHLVPVFGELENDQALITRVLQHRCCIRLVFVDASLAEFAFRTWVFLVPWTALVGLPDGHRAMAAQGRFHLREVLAGQPRLRLLSSDRRWVDAANGRWLRAGARGTRDVRGQRPSRRGCAGAHPGRLCTGPTL